MRVKFLRDKGFCKVGVVADLTESEANDLIDQGIAEAYSPPTEKIKSSKKLKEKENG